MISFSSNASATISPPSPRYALAKQYYQFEQHCIMCFAKTFANSKHRRHKTVCPAKLRMCQNFGHIRCFLSISETAKVFSWPCSHIFCVIELLFYKDTGRLVKVTPFFCYGRQLAFLCKIWHTNKFLRQRFPFICFNGYLRDWF